MDIQLVYDFIEDHIRYNKDERFDEYGNYGENNPPVSSEWSQDSQDKSENLA